MNENEMIERVAQAISESFREEGSFWDGRWESESEQAAFHDAARAVFEEITKAGYVLHRHHNWITVDNVMGVKTRMCGRCGAWEGGILEHASCEPRGMSPAQAALNAR